MLAALLMAVSFTGHTLAEALTMLQARGLNIVYSSALVRPAMVVEREPRASAPRAILDEILEPHALRAVESNGRLLIVAAATKKPAPPPFVDEIVVTPSHTRIVTDEVRGGDSLEEQEIGALPHVADDLTRAVKLLPGTAGTDVSAMMNVRGGASDEVLVTIDGLELYEPFHVKNFLSLFSTLDSAAVSRVDVMTGGSPVEYGDRIGAVMDVKLRPPETRSTNLTAGTLNGRIYASGRSNDSAEWMLSARLWYPDMLLGASRISRDHVNSDYYDLLARADRSVSSRSTASITLLGAYDNLAFHRSDAEESEQLSAEENSEHAWLNLETSWSPTVWSRTLLGIGRIARDRSGLSTDIDDAPVSIEDARSFNFTVFKQDWSFSPNDRHVIKSGAEARIDEAAYSYQRGNLDVQLQPHRKPAAAYVSDRFAIGDSSASEIGARVDAAGVSPRLSAMHRFAAGTIVRVGWGRYTQSQRLNELAVEDGVTAFSKPERAQERLFSIEHALRDLSLRVEAYDKILSSVRPRFENLFSPIELFPEAQDDRVRVAPDRARMRGIEVRLRNSGSGPVSWSAGYALARAVDRIAGVDVPRSWDQRHAVTATANLRLPHLWNAGLAATFHTGWPATPVGGARNRARYPSYFRLDARVSRSIATRRGAMEIVAEAINATNRKNVCCIDDFSRRYWAPIIPSLSVHWSSPSREGFAAPATLTK